MKHTDEEKCNLVERYQNGTSVASLCAETGIPRSTLYSWAKLYNANTGDTNVGVTTREAYLLKEQIKKMGIIITILKSVNCSVSSPLQEKLAAMEALYGQFSVHVLCEALEVPRGTFYNHMLRSKGGDTMQAARKRELSEVVREIFHDNKQLFGADKITAVLREQGFTVSKKYVLQLMREMGLYSISPIAKREYTKWQKGENKNIVQQQFEAPRPNMVWVSDMTQHRFRQQNYYVCAMLDLFSRKVVAYSTSKSSGTQLVTRTFKKAYAARQPAEGLVFHSDRGSQYTSKAFQNLLEESKVTQSLSRPGKPHDNAVMESFFSYLKKEELYRHEYKSEAAMFRGIDHYMLFYNSQRPHSTLQYKTPDKMEETYNE